MKKILEFNKFIDNLVEQSQTTNKNEQFVQNIGRIYVTGGGLNGNRREHGKPHFKLIKNNNENFRIEIPQKNENDLIIEDIIVLDDKDIKRELKKDIVTWLKLNNLNAKDTLGTNMSNLKYMAVQWNMLNIEDNNIKIIKLDIYEK